MRIADNDFIYELSMKIYDFHTGQLSSDLSNDILELGNFSSELNAYVVDDVRYIYDYADDWKKCRGDFFNDVNGSQKVRIVSFDVVDKR